MLSNFAAKGAQAIGVLVFTPLYLKVLSLEAMGLVGLWMAVRAFLTLLDFGMSTTLNREAAKSESKADLWKPIWTLETLSWSIAALAAVLFSLSAPWVATSWLKLDSTSPVIAQSSLILFGAAAAFQLPTLLYQGALTGLERQVPMNGILVIGTLVRDAGALAALFVFGKTPVTFFAWQLGVSVAICFAQRALMCANLPKPETKRSFDRETLREIGKFTAGTGLISVSVMFVGLADRIVLTKMVSLGAFGTYSVAQTAAGAVLILVSPITNAAFPRFVSLFSQRQPVSELYHSLAKMLSVLVFPTGAVMAGLAQPVLLAWTGNPGVTLQGAPILGLLAIATSLNGLAYLPLQAQLATGWTRLALGTNLLSAAVYIPVLIVASAHYGALGAAWAQVALMTTQLLTNPLLMHRRILQGEATRWLFGDCLLPALPSIAFLGVAWFVHPVAPSRLAGVGLAVVSWIGLVVCTVLITPQVRNALLARIRRPAGA